MGDSLIRGTERQWAAFSDYLSQTFKTQYTGQQNILNFLNTTLTNMVQNPQGFGAKALSALRGGATDTVTQQFQHAQQAIQANQAARGDFGGQVKSGVNAQIAGQLAGGQATAQAGELGNIELQNEQQKLTNQRIGLSGLSGVAAEMNPLGYSGAATGAAGTTGNLGSQYFGTDQSGFFDKLGSSFASGLGNVLSGNASASSGGF